MHNFVEKTRRQGIVFVNLTPEQDIIFREVDSRTGYAFSDFQRHPTVYSNIKHPLELLCHLGNREIVYYKIHPSFIYAVSLVESARSICLF